MDKIKVCVLLGGISTERNISLVTGKCILDNLDKEKYIVYAVDTADFSKNKEEIIKNTPLVDSHKPIIEELFNSDYIKSPDILFNKESEYFPDICYIALHGKGGEDGAIQGLLETLEIKYTGSNVFASSIAMNKSYTKYVLSSCGVKVPLSIDINTKLGYDISDIKNKITTYPVYVKASNQGSSIGVIRVEEEDELENTINSVSQYDNLVLIEEFIKGTEITVGVIGNDTALPTIEIVPSTGEYDLTSKYMPGLTNEICPARISSDLETKAKEIALKCHNVLCCSGISRTDMIIQNEDIYVLEVNTIPGMTPTSLIPIAAKEYGIKYPDLLNVIINSAL